MINDKQSHRCANFVSTAPAQLPEEAIRMRFPNKVTIGAIEKIRDLVKLQLHGAGPCILAVAPRQIPCRAGFPQTPLACARSPARGLFPAMDEMSASPLPPHTCAPRYILP